MVLFEEPQEEFDRDAVAADGIGMQFVCGDEAIPGVEVLFGDLGGRIGLRGPEEAADVRAVFADGAIGFPLEADRVGKLKQGV